MRQGELFALVWEDVDWTSGTIQVRHRFEEIKGVLRLKEVKTKKGRRRIKLAASTVAALHEHRKEMMAAGPLSTAFLSSDCSPCVHCKRSRFSFPS